MTIPGNELQFPIELTLDDMTQLLEPENDPSQGQGQDGGAAPVAAPVTPVPTATPDAATALREALRISEEARLSMQQQLSGVQQQQQQQQQQPQQKWFTDEELASMLNDENPAVRLQAMQINTNQQLARAGQYYEQRMNQLVGSMGSAAENEARKRFPKEFELFGSQIAQFAAQTGQGQLTSSTAWDNLVSYVRGLPGNIEKYIDAHIAAKSEQARQQQQNFSGFSVTSTPTPNSQSFSADPTTIQIAMNLGYDRVEDYIKDMKLFERMSR